MGTIFVTDNGNQTRKRTKTKNKNHVKTCARVVALVCVAMAGGQNAHAGRVVTGTDKMFAGAKGKKGTEL
jgi:hypothetical protein